MFLRFFDEFINIENCNKFKVDVIKVEDNVPVYGIIFKFNMGDPTTISCPGMSKEDIIESAIAAMADLKSSNKLSAIMYLNKQSSA